MSDLLSFKRNVDPFEINVEEFMCLDYRGGFFWLNVSYLAA